MKQRCCHEAIPTLACGSKRTPVTIDRRSGRVHTSNGIGHAAGRPVPSCPAIYGGDSGLRGSWIWLVVDAGRMHRQGAGRRTRELRWWHAAATEMCGESSVILSQQRDGCPALLQRLQPLLVQFFVPELAVGALDALFCMNPRRVDQQVPNAMRMARFNGGTAGTPRAFAGVNAIGCQIY